MQQQPQTIYGPNGERADWNGREYVVASPAAPAAGGYQLQPMVTPAEQRAREEREYDRQRDAERDARLDRNEGRQIDTQERLARTEERAVANAELTQRGGTPELRGRLALGLGPSVRAVDSMAAQHEGVNPLNRDWGATLIDSVPDFGLLSAGARLVGGQDYQDYNQSLKTVESSLLPIFSGMAVTPTEAQRFMKANQPQLGDSPETIRRKTQNVQIILNEGAFLAGREIPYPEVGRYGEEGFRELLAAGDVSGVTSPRIGGTGTPPAGPAGEPNAPTGGPDAPVDISGMSAADLLALTPGTAIRLPDGTVTRLTGAPSVGAQGREVSPGVFTQETPDEAQGRYREDVTGADRQAAGFMRGVVDTATFGLSDEIAAGIDTVLPPIAGQRSGWQDGFGPAYRQNVANYRAFADADEEDVSGARIAGQVTGGFVPVLGAARAATGSTRLARTGQRMAVGGAYGGAYGFGSGEGNALERLPSTGAGMAFGAAAGPVAPVAANALSRAAAPVVRGVQSANRFVGRQVVNALGDSAPTALREAVQPNPLRSGMDRFADRSPQNVNALNAEASRYRDEEIAPAFADVVNDGGRGTMRALATRQTPARQAAREFADGRAAGLQDRVSTQARRTISDDPRQPAQIREEIATRRNRQADQQFGAVRGDRISPDREILEALRAPAMRPAIEEAATSAANRGDMDTAGMLRALSGDAMDYGADAQITVGMADRIARSLNGRAEAFQRSGNNDAAASHFALAERLRGGARQQAPGYDEALKAYGQDSGLAAATELGEQFMTMEADAFAAAVANLSPDEQQIARATARRSVERQAGTQGNAPGVAQRLSNGREQGARTAALVGDAAPVQRAMGAELQTLRNAQAVNPAQGSQTSQNLQDAAGAIGVGRDVATGNVLGLAGRAMNAIRSRGFNDAEAQAVVEAAIDPARTDELIGMLAQRMNRREARNLARAIRYQITTGLQSGQQN